VSKRRPDHGEGVEKAEAHFVSRGGHKLAAALQHFQIHATARHAVDLGANVGGFTDCLLQAGAERVYAVDTGFGTLAWKLRQDPRVCVLERTNALHATPQSLGLDQRPGGFRSDLVVLDLGWTRQQRAIPAALAWLSSGPEGTPPGLIVSLIKPQYEAPSDAEQNFEAENSGGEPAPDPGSGPAKRRRRQGRGSRPGYEKGVLSETEAAARCERVLAELPSLGVRVLGCFLSPLRGGASRRKRPGNVEYLALLQPLADPD